MPFSEGKYSEEKIISIDEQLQIHDENEHSPGLKPTSGAHVGHGT